MYKGLLTSLISFCLLLSTSINAETLKIATWNIAWLGSGEYNTRTNEQYAELAKYAKQLNADVISLQEVESAEYAKKVFGDEYNYYFSTKDWIQRVGVAVKKSTGLSVQAIEYKNLDVGKVRHGMDLTLSNGDKKLRLLAVHLKSGCFDKKLDKASVKQMHDRSDKDIYKKVACATLSNQISPLENWIDDRAKENTPYLILGDFNRRFAQDIKNDYNEEQGLWQAIDDENNEHLWTPTLTKNSDCWGGYYKDYIDHIVLDPRAKANMVKGSFEQVVFEGKYSKKLSNALSDHCPIAIKLYI